MLPGRKGVRPGDRGLARTAPATWISRQEIDLAHNTEPRLAGPRSPLRWCRQRGAGPELGVEVVEDLQCGVRRLPAPRRVDR